MIEINETNKETLKILARGKNKERENRREGLENVARRGIYMIW